ncbi:MAG: CARDB domain-containing protein [Thermoplasmata archaeon]|nr:CARDB domain-containing protein [Thermoplasmata archaeon]
MSRNKTNLMQKFVSVFILWCMAAGGFMAIFTAQVGSGSISQPMPMVVPEIITGTITYENEGIMNADHGITINSGGTLKIINSTLNFPQDDNTDYFIHVNKNGALILENSTITTGATPQAMWDPMFEMTFKNATLEMNRNSVLAFPGWLNVTGTRTYINDSWITSLEPAIFLTDYALAFPTFRGVVDNWWTGTPRDLTDTQDDGPIMNFYNCDNVTIADSRIDEMYEEAGLIAPIPKPVILHPDDLSPSNGTGNLSDILTLGDSNYYSLNGWPQTINITGFDILPFNDVEYEIVSTILYIVYNNPGFTFTSGNESKNCFWYYVPGYIGSTPAGQILEDQTLNTAIEVDISSNINTFNFINQLGLNFTSYEDNSVGGPNNISFDLIQLNVTLIPKYDNYTTMITVNNTDMTVINTYVSVDWCSFTDEFGFKNAFDLKNGSNLFMYNTTISEDESLLGTPGIPDFTEIPVGAVATNYMPFRVEAGSEAYYYKWLEVDVTDRYSKAVPGAYVNASFHFTNETFVNQVSRINNLTSDSDSTWANAKKRVTDYLGRMYGVTVANYNITRANGKAMLPLLTTFINNTNTLTVLPNGDHVGEYDIRVNYTNATSVEFVSMTTCDFKPVPNIMPEDNVVIKPVQLSSLILPRPFGSPGLIVNGNEIVNMDGGVSEALTVNDFIIVEDNGFLRISNAAMLMAYSGNAPYEIIVRDNGRLVLDNVDLKTQGNMPIKIYLQDKAAFTMTDSSTTSWVDMIAYNDAEITFNGTVLGGNFDTAPDANIRLNAWSTSFGKNLDDFNGTSEAVLVGCYSPSNIFSIVPKDSSKVWVYRLVEVTVKDGVTPANTLENVNVWLTNQDHDWGSILSKSGVTNNVGKFKTFLLSDYLEYNILAHYASYSLVTEYTLNSGIVHNETTSLGLATYSIFTPTGMLSADAISKREIILENVLPDLDPPITVWPIEGNTSVGRGNEVWINTTVTNAGDAVANGIMVWFDDIFDNTTSNIHSEYIPTLAPGENKTVFFPWTWDSIDDIGWHNITVFVDPLDSVKEQDENNNKNYTWINITSQSDLAIIQYYDVWFSETYPLIDEEFSIYANVWNMGDLDATNVTVSFSTTNGTFLGNATAALIPANPSAPTVVSIPVTFTVNGTYYILAVIDEANVIPEVDEGNNDNSVWPRELHVYEYPDLYIQSLQVIEGTNLAEISIGGGTPIPDTYNRTKVTLRARVNNLGELFASTVFVRFYDGAQLIGTSNIISSITTGSYTYATLTWTAPTNGLQQIHNIRAIAYADNNLVSNEMNTAFTVYDNRPDLEIVNYELANNVTEITANTVFDLNVTVRNNGLNVAVNSTFGIYSSEDDWNTTRQMWNSGHEVYTGRIGNTTVLAIASGETMILTIHCTGIDVGLYNLYITADPDVNSTDVIEYDDITPIIGDIEEYSELNNNGTMSLTVILPDLFVKLQLPSATEIEGKWANVYTEGETTGVLVTGFVVREDNPTLGVPGILVTIEITNLAGSAIDVTTTAGGFFSATLPVSEVGNYTVQVSGNNVNSATGWFRIAPADVFPWWIIIVIIILVVVTIVVITAYLYFVGLGKTVQCGECGAFIPESAKKCPKCAVEFETEVAKCSVCGAWVPIDVKNCTECGTEFTVGTENLDDYEAKMKRQFDDIVRKFRTEAKQDLGQEFTETEFQAWWAAKPTFITFDLWLKEEEEMKRMGSRPCPVCETENSVTAKICHKCGTVMGEPEKAAPKKPEGKLPPQEKKPEAAKPGAAPVRQQPPAQTAPQQTQAAPQAAPVPVQQSATTGKKGCPSCGMEVNATEKVCPICNFDFEKPTGGDQVRRIVRKPIKKVVRRPIEGGDQQQPPQP